MDGYTRYAIFYAPPSGSALHHFGARWLGWDAEAGQVVVPPSGLDFDISAATATPRRYGFHGTLKPPFALAKGCDAPALADALAALAGRLAPVTCAPLRVQRLGGFLALRPAEASPALSSLAGACVQELDALRAPSSAEDLARRRAAGLSLRQEAYLTRWGYPYVLEEFRFHLTLTGALDAETLPRATEAAQTLAAPFLSDPFTIRELCLFGEDATRRFHLLSRFPLGGA